jgi:hypothetical protein
MRFLSIEYAIPGKQVTNEEIVRKILEKSGPHFSNKALTVLEDSFYKLFKISQTNIRYHRNPLARRRRILHNFQVLGK